MISMRRNEIRTHDLQKGATMERRKTALLLKIGILGALVILCGDLLMGWDVKDMQLPGLEAQLSPYLTLSRERLFWAAVCGFAGVPLAVAGHFGIYGLMKPCSRKYAGLYALGNLGFLAFGGAGVHVSSVEAAYFYQHMTAASPETALSATVDFAVYFLLPLYVIMIACWAAMVYAHLRVVFSPGSPFSGKYAVWSMPVGTLLFSLVGLLGNHAFTNAVAMGAFSLGNIWCLAGHLYLLNKEK